jgi:hypothetical protein
VAQQGPPPPRSGRLPAPRRGDPRRGDPRRSYDDEYPEPGEELPPWAGLGVRPRWAEREEEPAAPDVRRPGDGPPGGNGGRSRGRLAAARARKNRRSVYRWGILLVVVALIGGGTWKIIQSSNSAAPLPGQIVTKYLPGEFRTVPDVCKAVNGSTLDHYLPGKRTTAAPGSIGGNSTSLCGWTLDARPLYRLLNVQAEAYAPNGLAGGDGSATFAAIDAYQQTKQQKVHPLKSSGLPKATVTELTGIGTAAFSALQVVTKGGDTTDLLTVVVRDHNVVVTSVLEGIDRSSRGGYGPVSPAQLRAGALAAARDVLAGVG